MPRPFVELALASDRLRSPTPRTRRSNVKRQLAQHNSHFSRQRRPRVSTRRTQRESVWVRDGVEQDARSRVRGRDQQDGARDMRCSGLLARRHVTQVAAIVEPETPKSSATDFWLSPSRMRCKIAVCGCKGDVAPPRSSSSVRHASPTFAVPVMTQARVVSSCHSVDSSIDSRNSVSSPRGAQLAVDSALGVSKAAIATARVRARPELI